MHCVYTFVVVFRQWTSFLAGASTAAYVYMYSFYYYFFKTKSVTLTIARATKLFYFRPLISIDTWLVHVYEHILIM